MAFPNLDEFRGRIGVSRYKKIASSGDQKDYKKGHRSNFASAAFLTPTHPTTSQSSLPNNVKEMRFNVVLSVTLSALATVYAAPVGNVHDALKRGVEVVRSEEFARNAAPPPWKRDANAEAAPPPWKRDANAEAGPPPWKRDANAEAVPPPWKRDAEAGPPPWKRDANAEAAPPPWKRDAEAAPPPWKREAEAAPPPW